MIRCPSCDATYAENTLFCEECGAFLMAQNNHTTDRLPASDPVCEAVGRKVPPRTLILSIRDGAHIEIPFSKDVVLGRLDASRAIFPDIDLTNEGGLRSGVSRRHARIFRTDDGLAIEDLASLNGTFLNGQRLTPEIPYSIQDGDELQIGTLILTVNLC
jgi:pSer/pThr/pTyr-binding forkhead associated (FHA) protein